MKALVVDDSRAMRLILSRLLREIGFEVVDAAQGTEALALLDHMGDTDLALVDWHMPEMDGLAFVAAVRARRAHDRLKILMVTTASEQAQLSLAMAAGADGYLLKPFTSGALREKVLALRQK